MPKTPKLLKGQSKKYDIASITRYIADTAAWMDRQPLIPYVSLSGRDCYALRCAITHQGSDQTDRQAAADVLRRFEFVASSIDAINFHNNLSGDQLQLDVTKFCNEICEAVIAWEAQTSAIRGSKSREVKTTENPSIWCLIPSRGCFLPQLRPKAFSRIATFERGAASLARPHCRPGGRESATPSGRSGAANCVGGWRLAYPPYSCV